MLESEKHRQMSPTDLQLSLLRPPVLHVLRAAGFHAARPAAVETLVDLTARYLILIASKTADYAWSNHGSSTPTVTDIRMALQYVGALRPELGPMEEQQYYDDDMRGMEAFISWFSGEGNKEIMRIAGLVETEGQLTNVEPGQGREDYLAGKVTSTIGHLRIDRFIPVLKKKHSKTGEESKFQGTILGKSAEEKLVKIDGGDIETIHGWESKLKEDTLELNPRSTQTLSSASSMSSPLSSI